MTYHYHVLECPHCGKQHQRGCNLDNCTTAAVSLESFVSQDGNKAERALCLETGRAFYMDFGDRPTRRDNDYAGGEWN